MVEVPHLLRQSKVRRYHEDNCRSLHRHLPSCTVTPSHSPVHTHTMKGVLVFLTAALGTVYLTGAQEPKRCVAPSQFQVTSSLTFSVLSLNLTFTLLNLRYTCKSIRLINLTMASLTGSCKKLNLIYMHIYKLAASFTLLCPLKPP